MPYLTEGDHSIEILAAAWRCGITQTIEGDAVTLQGTKAALAIFRDELIAAERERCAKLVEDACAWTGGHGMPGTPSGHELAKLIRKQPNTGIQRAGTGPLE